MLTSKAFFIILYTASNTRKDISVLLSRTTLASMSYIIFIIFNHFFFKIFDKSMSIYNGVFQFNNIIYIFNAFILLLTTIIITLGSFYPRKGLTLDAKSSLLLKKSETTTDLKDENKKMKITDLEHENNKMKITDLENENNKMKVTDLEDESNKMKVTDLEHENNEVKNWHLVEHNEVVLGKKSKQFKIKEYVLIISFIVIGAILLMSVNDLISLFLSIELQSYGLYLLTTIYRNSELSTKAGLTYFLLGGLSSCIILLGQGILYINSGNTSIENIYILHDITYPIMKIIGTVNIYTLIQNMPQIYDYYYINLSLAILSAGFMFKVSAAPFHFWSPDVYDSVPTTVTTFIAIIAKISIFILFLDLIHYTSNIYLKSSWINNLLISCLLSLIIGSVLGLSQFRIKRLYAYSTINHIGFILLALCINTFESIQAFIFYIIQYSVSNLNAFIILLTMGYFILTYYNDNKEYKDLIEKNNSPIQFITQLKGFYKINNMLSLSLAITLLSFLGVPPLLGFFGKQMVLSAALNNGYVFITLIAVITSVISAVYYLVVIKHIFFDNNEHVDIINDEHIMEKLKNIKLSSHLTSCISILTLIILIYMFSGRIWLDSLIILCISIFNL